MSETTIGLLHPGEMGAAVGKCLAGAGHQVLWVPEGRSAATRERAEAAGLTGVALAEIVSRSDVIVSVCPPHAALDVARQVAGFGGLYLDANAISPATAREVAAIVEAGGASYVDGGIIGTPPVAPGLHPAVPVRAARRGGTGAVRRHRRGRAGGAAAGHGVRGEDGVRVVDQGVGRAAAGGAGAGPGRGRGGRLLAEWGISQPGLEGRSAARGRVRGGQGLALDRRDGGDRRDHGRGRASRGISPGRGRDLPPVSAGAEALG